MIKSRPIAVLLLSLAAGVLAACGATVGTTISDTELVSADGVTLLEVDNDNGEVVIEASQADDNMISVNYQLRNSGDIDFSVTRVGDRVVVRAEDNSGPLDNAEANLSIRLPSQIAVVAGTGNGLIALTGMQSSVDADTGNGNITLQGTGGPGTQSNLNSGNGRIEVEDHIGALQVNTGNGAIVISGHVGQVTANAGNGRIEYDGSIEAFSENRTTTGNGDISVTLRGGATVVFGIETADGDITVDPEYVRSGTPSDDRVSGIIGTPGSAALLEISSGRGDVTLRHVPGS